MPGYGPAMTACSPTQRKYVEARYAYPTLHPMQCLVRIGYKSKGSSNPDNQHAALQTMAYRMERNKQVQDAIREMGGEKMVSSLPKAIAGLDAIISNSKARDHFKAIDGVLNRTGMHPVTESKQTVTHTIAVEDMRAQLKALFAKPGMQALLPSMPTITDGASVTECEAIESSD